MKKLRTLRTLAVATAITATTLITGAAEPGPTTSSGDSGVTIDSPADVTLTGPDAADFRLHQQRRLSGDVHLTSWTDGKTTIRVTTRPGSRVRVETTPDGITVDATQNTDTQGKSAAQLAARHQQRGMSAAEQQIEMGMDAHEARTTFTAGTSVGAPAEKGPIIGNWCVDIDAEDGKLESYGCNTRYLVQDDENGRYIADEMITSAVSTDDTWFPYGLTRVDSILIYAGDDQVISWNPISDQPLSECSDVTAGIEVEGISYSVTTPICPDTFGPSVIPDADTQQFGAAWSGPQSAPNNYMATQGVTLVEEKNSQATTLRNKIKYTW